MAYELISTIIIMYLIIYILNWLYLYVEYDIDICKRSSGQTGASLLLHNLVVIIFSIPIILVGLGHMTYSLGRSLIAWLTNEG